MVAVARVAAARVVVGRVEEGWAAVASEGVEKAVEAVAAAGSREVVVACVVQMLDFVAV